MRPKPNATIVLGGFTGSGKSTLARTLGERTGYASLSGSSHLVAAMGDATPRTTRLRDWLTKEQHSRRDAQHDRSADLAILAALQDAGPRIVDSSYFALLSPPQSSVVRVWIEASLDVRARRIRNYLNDPDLSVTDCLTIVARKDRATCHAARNAWAIDLTATEAVHFRHDLILKCPHEAEDDAPEKCASAMADLAYSFWTLTHGGTSHDGGPHSESLMAWESVRETLSSYLVTARIVGHVV